jgi:hypothetical protein
VHEPIRADLRRFLNAPVSEIAISAIDFPPEYADPSQRDPGDREHIADVFSPLNLPDLPVMTSLTSL